MSVATGTFNGPVGCTDSESNLIVGAVANSNVSTFTPTPDWTTIGAVSGGSGAGKRTVTTMFQYANAGGPYAATGNLSGSGFWQAEIIG